MEEKEIEEFEGLSLRYAYEFLAQKGLKKEADEIRQSKDKYKSYDSTLRRSKIIELLEDHNLLEEFIDSYWPLGKTNKGKGRIRRYKKIYGLFTGKIKPKKPSIGEISESDLRDYLADNLSLIEPRLQLYVDRNGEDGVEYPVEGGWVDILAKDKNDIPVIVELKAGRGKAKVVGQCLHYRAQVKHLLGSQKVRIIIIAREITPQLRAATQDLPDIDLFEYRLSVNVERILSH